jgi:uncharacterized protein
MDIEQWQSKYGDYALITGASAGIGRAFAQQLAAKGLNLIIAARRLSKLQSLADDLSSNYHINVLPIELDLTRDDFMDLLVQKTHALKIGLLVNNAGRGSIAPLVQSDPAVLEQLVKLNCLAPTLLANHFGQLMAERGQGGIIFLGSVVGYHASPYIAAYSASKVFNIYLAEALWYELKQQGVDVLCLSPGGTETEFQRVSNMSAGPLVATPQEVAALGIKFLGKKQSVIHGWHNKLWAFFNRLLPRTWDVRLSGYALSQYGHEKPSPDKEK